MAVFSRKAQDAARELWIHSSSISPSSPSPGSPGLARAGTAGAAGSSPCGFLLLLLLGKSRL